MTMNKIILFDLPGFQGKSQEYGSDVSNMSAFGDSICSVKITGQPWVLYPDPASKERPLVLEEGEYHHVNMNKIAYSMRVLTEDLDDPKITLYELPKFTGRQQVLTAETALNEGESTFKASSHTVESGVWLLYTEANRNGKYLVSRARQRMPNYTDIHFSDTVCHVRPLKSGRPSVTAELLLDELTTLSEEDVLLDTIESINMSDDDRKFTTSRIKEYEEVITHSFKFDEKSTLKAGVEFDLPDLSSAEPEQSVSFRVVKGKTEAFSITQKKTLTLPSATPANTKLTVKILRKEVTCSVPVKLTIMHNNKKREEDGEYRCVLCECPRSEVHYKTA